MNGKPIHEMSFEEYYLYQLPTATHYAPGQPESFYRRQARRNFENTKKVERVRIVAAQRIEDADARIASQ